MPLTPVQRRVLGVLAANRSEASHFAGGVLLTAPEDSDRYSHDLDVFHEAQGEVVRASERDVADLIAAGFTVEKLDRAGEWSQEAVSFRKARVQGADGSVDVDWVHDSAFRFFPVERDERLGFRLHRFDLAVNKALTIGARSETRDYIDILELGRLYPLAAICWAAPGKDPGFSPLSLLKWMLRNARIRPEQLHEIRARALDPVEMKERWIEMSDRAWAEIERIGDTMLDLPIGVAFVDDAGRPGWIGDDPTLRLHPPSLRGCWPEVRVVEDES